MENKFNNGIHHISVLAGDAQVNANFYVKTLGMRLVKKSVNQDDPGVYHLFYGNAKGSPGSGLTFFPWPLAKQGAPGVGEATKIALAVPKKSMSFWLQYFLENRIDHTGPYNRFGQQAIGFRDPDNLQLELVFDSRSDSLQAWDTKQVPAEYGIRGFRGTTLRLEKAESTAAILTSVFGFEKNGQSDQSSHYTTDAPIGGSVIIEESQRLPQSNGRGIIHHVAFRAKDMDDLKNKREQVLKMGLFPTEVIDRHWFYAVYFRTPGRVLFEISTDGPGYAVDEDPDKLGEKLILPPWLESQRKRIEERLPEIHV